MTAGSGARAEQAADFAEAVLDHSTECPEGQAMLSPRRGAMEAEPYTCSTTEDAIASALTALAAAECTVEDGLKEALLAFVAAKEAESAGDAATAREGFATAIALAPARLLEPCQTPLAPETLEWAGSRWTEQALLRQLLCMLPCELHMD